MIEELAALVENRKLVLAATAAGGLMFAYIAILYALGDPRLADGKLTGGESFWWEWFLIGSGVCSTLLLWISGAAHAWTARRWKWFLGSIFIWPIGIIYVLILHTSWVGE